VSCVSAGSEERSLHQEPFYIDCGEDHHMLTKFAPHDSFRGPRTILVEYCRMSVMLVWREAPIMQWTTTTRVIDFDGGKVDLSFHGLCLQT
jgi:hypothetical protein